MHDDEHGTRTETSGGSGAQPHPRAREEGADDPAVEEHHEEATRTLRESGGPVAPDEQSGTTSGG